MVEPSWVRDSAGAFACETAMSLLVVKQISGAIRFLVFRRSQNADGPVRLFASGTTETTQAAMAAAQRVARRL